MRSFQDIFETRKRSLISVFSICMTVPLTKITSLFTDYDKVIKQYLKKGVVEYVENSDNKMTPGQVHYLPHRAAIRENNETTMLRIACNASSKAKGEHCLNDILCSGPCLLPYL